ncbi:dipicolinate synthase subunit A [Lysinibacillus sp. KU-BSD001]|uniref:dipicolinate synthase subunit A n=1 Tax=Lysinibacillus sp. KU-BSD001 TaxID=3141328 RepID=UPI0036EF56A6
MTERWLVIGMDARMKELAKKMSSPNRTIFYKKATGWDAGVNATVLDFCPDKVVLPIQPLTLDVPLLLGTKHVTFFTGRLTDDWRGMLKQEKVVPYLENESFIWKNAGLTAESFISYLYEKRQTIRGKHFIVTGFGRVAKLLAQALTGLHANVTIAVRSHTQKYEAAMLGYEAIYLQPQYIKEATALINTIPAQWLTQSFSEVIKMPIYDLASAPGCLYYVTRSDYELLLALPGKYFPDDAAQLLYDSIVEGCEC